ncbi:TIM-barrel domain-containing protein [Sorangium sp. So ce185]|uniref:TIM-barrel domain-containing protein n=1 Tax=Sorangium sp. So ce185 TaxID=3133287 RepID=UPI003F639E10
MRSPLPPPLALIALLLPACSSTAPPGPEDRLLRFESPDAAVEINTAPFALRILDAEGNTVLETAKGAGDGAYGGPAATIDEAVHRTGFLPGWDEFTPIEGPWRRAAHATVRAERSDGATIELARDGLFLTLDVSLDGPRVRLALDASEAEGQAEPGALNKTSLSFALRQDEHFYGLGERFATVDHRGQSLYAWAEEGGLGQGEDAPAGPGNPYPNGPSMTYFPVPFFLSSQGYGVYLDTTFRSEVHLGSEASDTWRMAVDAPSFAATIYVRSEPLAAIADYTEDTGRPPVPAPWVFGPRRRVNRGSMIDGVDEYLLMRQRDIPITGIDDALHFLPALSHLGVEDEVAQWTSDLHAAGYKVMAYNNPYIAENAPNAEADYTYAKDHGFLVKGPDGEPSLTTFISGQLLTVAAVDLTNPDAVAWYKDLLRRTLDLGYDGWMHDFGEYTAHDAVFHDGRRGDEVHNEFPVLSARAAHELLEEERPGDYLFFVRSGYSGTQALVPAVWGGDAEATFDETQGLPSAVRGGLNLSMSGVPYWGSDVTGFKCITSAPNDKEVFLRWVQLGAASPIMMEQDACSNPVTKKTKWKLWNDQETQDVYAKYARLHTRLLPYFMTLAEEAANSGKPLSMHPFLLHPRDPAAWSVDDAYYLGPALYVAPVVRRGETSRKAWLPPAAQYVDLDDLTAYPGGSEQVIPAPLEKLPLLLVSEQILPLLDPSIDTLAPAADPSVVTLEQVSDRLDVLVALPPGGRARLTLADGTTLEASRGAEQGNPGALEEASAATIEACASCFLATSEGGVERLRATSKLAESSEIALEDVTLTAKGGPARRVRWDVLRLRP